MSAPLTHRGLPPLLRRTSIHGDTWGVGPFTLRQADNPEADFNGLAAQAGMVDEDGNVVIEPAALSVTVQAGSALAGVFEIRDWTGIPNRNQSYLATAEATLPSGAVVTLVRVLLTVIPSTLS